MITPRSSGFYNRWWRETLAILNDPASDPDWLKVREQTGEYYLEEYIVDKLFHADSSILRPVQRYQIGEWYTPVKEFTDEELKQVYFWHEHLIADPKYNRVREKVEYFNRMAKIRGSQ
jgi:isoleucyl-tRNA synthetase